jgi:hypothetical protein
MLLCHWQSLKVVIWNYLLVTTKKYLILENNPKFSINQQKFVRDFDLSDRNFGFDKKLRTLSKVSGFLR